MSDSNPPTRTLKPDARKLVRTKTPGIYKRGGSYVVVYRAAGKQRKEYARTLEQARAIKRAREADRDRGEFQPPSKLTLREFLSGWVDRYAGTGRRGFRENTREEYRRLLAQYAHRYFGDRLRLVDVTPYVLAQWVAWLADESEQGKRLSDKSIGNIAIPVRAALATAQREGLIRHNPAQGLALPHRESVSEDEDDVKALSREQLDALLMMAPRRYRLLFEVLASCGLRISEAIALQRKHLQLDGSRPHIRVSRAIVRGRVEPPKSRHGRRSVALPQPLAFKLRTHLAGLADQSADALVFANQRSGVIDPDNLRARTFKPLAEEAGAGWAGFHTLRHTYASLQLSRGVNLVALSRALGHHSAAFTLTRYAHLLPGDEAPPLDVAAHSAGRASGVSRAVQSVWAESSPH